MNKLKKTLPTYTSQNFAGIVVMAPTQTPQGIIPMKKIKVNAPALYQHFLNETCKPGDEITMIITNKRPKRSEAQNNYLHLYLSLIGTSSGHTMAELKAWVKGKFLSKGITEVYGDKVRVVKSTSELNISEFMELLERLEKETKVPLPNTEPFNRVLTEEEYQTLKVEQKKIYDRITARLRGI
jgi:hypothetical protein